MASTLFDYYKGKGQTLPSIQSRAQLYQQSGLGNASSYSGTAEQNTRLLRSLEGGGGQSAPQPPPQAQSQPQTSANPLDDVNKMIQDAFTNLNTEANRLFGEYNKNRPFNLDLVLAESGKQAAEQIDPYYKESLNTYLTGVERRITRSKEDAETVLGELSEQTKSYSKDLQDKLASATEQAEEGFANVGLLESGKALRTEGQIEVEGQNQLTDFLRGQGLRQDRTGQGLTRGLEDIGMERTGNVRDIERERFTQGQLRTNQLAQEAGQSYVRGFQQVLPPQLQANTGFDLLKSLGIPG
jgi:hypothetical protein